LRDKARLDTKITPDLREEGIIREILRYIQGMRKTAKFKPKDRILVRYSGAKELNEILSRNKDFILRETKAKSFEAGKRPKSVFNIEKEIKIDQQKLWLAVKKI
jgi:isoleucyl-tRNA synthetase